MEKKYNIGNEIIFDPNSHTITSINTDVEKKLPIPASRLLYIMIKSEQNIITREFLLHNVWEKHGLTGSDNNLNHYVSLLRRTFKELGLKENFIITIPKTGLKLNTYINYLEIPTRRLKNKKIMSKYYWLFIITILLLIFYLYHNQYIYKSSDNPEVSRDNCNIHSVNGSVLSSKAMQDFLLEYNIKCYS